MGGFGAELGPGQQGSGEDSREGSGRLWCRARSGPQGSGEGSGGLQGFGAEPGQVQQGSGEGSGEGLVEPGQVQQDLRPFNSLKPS